MKIVHINALEAHGGAGIACARVSGALRKLGHDSRMLVTNKYSSDELVAEIATRADLDLRAQITKCAIENQYVSMNRTSLTNTHFSVYVDGVDLSRHELIESADVVHLHWVASFQTPSDLGRLAEKKPLVWTLHDLEPLTGGCHFPAGCVGFQTTCVGCPQLAPAAALQDKKALWQEREVVLTSPTRWLADQAQKSAVFRDLRSPVVIPHAIDTEAFRPISPVSARRALGLRDGGLHVLCGASDNGERRKGADVLRRVLARCAAELGPAAAEVTVVSVGRSAIETMGMDGLAYRHLGHLESEARLALAYSAADLFILPSLEDNLPNMLLEAMSCGTPVVAFRVGGIEEVLVDGLNGRLVAAADEDAMSAAVVEMLSSPDRLGAMRPGCRRQVECNNGYDAIGRRYVKLYQSVVDANAHPRLQTGSTGRRPTGARANASGPVLDSLLPQWTIDCLALELKQRVEACEAIEAVAAERGNLIEDLHEAAEKQRLENDNLRAAATERHRRIVDLHEAAQEQRREIEKLQAVAQERQYCLEELHGAAQKQRQEMEDLRAVAEERRNCMTVLHESAEKQRRETQILHAIAEERLRCMEELHASAEKQRQEMERLHAIAEERLSCVEELHASAEKQRQELERLHAIAEERRICIEDLHALAEKQRTEIDKLHQIAAERLKLVDTLHAAARTQRCELERLREIIAGSGHLRE